MYGEHTKPRRVINGTTKIYEGNDIYVCCGRKKDIKCSHQIRAQFIHDKVFKELKKIVSNSYVFNGLVKERESRLGTNTDSLKIEIDELNNQLKSKKDFLSKLELDYEKGDLTALLYTKHTNKTMNEITALETRIRKIKTELSKSNVKIESPDLLKLALKNFLKDWNNTPNESKKIIIRSFLPRIEVDKQSNIYIATSLPVSLIFSLKQ